MQITALLLFIACLVLPADLAAQETASKIPGMQQRHGFGILPEPQQVRVTDTRFPIDGETVVRLDGADDHPFVLSHLQDGVQELTAYRPPLADEERTANVIILRIVPESELTNIPAGNARRRDGYTLDVTADRATITAAHGPGLLYGVQSFLQLLGQGRTAVSGISVVDWPDMEFRGIHLTQWYHQLRPWYFRHLFRQLSAYKVNTVIIEFEDKIPYPDYPVLSAPGAFTREEMLELVAEARRYYIDVIPLAQTIGHAAFIAKHQEFIPLREVPKSNWQLCPIKEGFPELARAVMDANMAITPESRYYHIGGDEARELGEGAECRARWGDRAVVESYRLWLHFVCDYLKQHGRTAIVWDDMFLKYFSDDDMRDMPENLVYMRWSYRAEHHPEEWMWRLQNQGFPVWVASSAQTITPVFADQTVRIANNATFIPDAIDHGITGAVCTSWEDAGTHSETYWIGFAALAEYAWSGAGPTIPEFRKKFFATFHGPDAFGMDEVYDTLSEVGFLKNEHRWTPQYRGMTLPPLPDQEFHAEPGWQADHAELVRMAKEREPRFRAAVETIRYNLRHDIRNRYAMEVVLICAKTLLHCTQGILWTAEINELFQQAQRDQRQADGAAAVGRYEDAGRIIDDWLYAQEQLYAETVRVWEKGRFPKDFRHIPGGRARFVHKLDRVNYYENMTMDLTHLLQVEKRLGLFDYQQRLYETLAIILREGQSW